MSSAPRSDRRTRTRRVYQHGADRPHAPTERLDQAPPTGSSGRGAGAGVDDNDGRDTRELRVFGPTGRLLMEYVELAALFAKPGFSSQTFIERHMAQLSKSGFEHARQELDKFMNNVSNQILESAINNNEIYVALGEAVHTMEPHLQRLHGLLTALRSLLAQLSLLATGGAEDMRSASLSAAVGGAAGGRDGTSAAITFGSLVGETDAGPDVVSPELARVLPVWRTFTQHLELALTERKLHKVHRMLSAAEGILDGVLSSCGPDSGAVASAASLLPLQLWIEQKEFYLEALRRSAISLLEAAMMEVGIARADLQQHARLLSKLSTPLHALACMLAAHEQTLDAHIAHLRARQGLEGDDFELLGAVSQRVFGTIGCAANDMSLIFRKAARELSSAFTVWALRLTERCVKVLLVDVLEQFAAPLGLPTTMECILQMMVYCSCLEDTHRVCLLPHMLRVLWPHIEAVIAARVDSACDRVRTAAMTDVSDTVASGRSAFAADTPSPSGAQAIREVSSLADELLCMDAIEVGKSMRQATIVLFRALCEGVQRGVQQAELQSKGAMPAVLAEGGGQIMACLTHFMEAAMPRALAPYSAKLGALCVRSKMEPALHAVASTLGMQEATRAF